MGLPCSVPELPNPPAVLRCGWEGYLSKDVGALMANLTGVVTYAECADHCATRVDKCRSFGYSSAARLCSLYANTLAAQGLKKKAGSGTKFWNRKCFGRCTCPANSTWDGSQCNCKDPYIEDFYGGVCDCPYIGQSLNADGSQCICPGNQGPVYVNVTEPDAPRQPNTGNFTQRRACGCNAPSFLQSNGNCTCPGSATYEKPLGGYAYCSCPNNQEFLPAIQDCGCSNKYNLNNEGVCECPDNSYVSNNVCTCRAQGATKQSDGSCTCAPPLQLSDDFTQCKCPSNQQLDPETNQCGCSLQQYRSPGSASCFCKASAADSQADGTCVCPGNRVLSANFAECICPKNQQLDNDRNFCGCTNTQLQQPDGTCIEGGSCPDTSVRVDGGQCVCDDGTLLDPSDQSQTCPLFEVP